ncbi:MAG: COX15/CtaA family protein [Chloroflexi bacterium]|nr:COX15/CtaA family protein [Chloroflexota bacterium]MCY3938862.1 COX15/CtaA family protein [Chloroflexota bacterium]
MTTAYYRFLLKVTLITIAASIVLVALGGVVRVTGSGLACPDWPLCQGQVLPPAERGTTLEFAHRLTATAVGSLVLGIALYSLRVRHEAASIFYAAVISGVLVLAQIILGAIVIFAKLSAIVVTAHLGLATAFVGALAVIAGQALLRLRGGEQSPDARRTTRATLVAAALTYATLLLGAYVATSGSSLACPQWPLCNDTVIPTGDWRQWIGLIHRILAAAMTIAVIWATWTAYTAKAPRQVRGLLHGAAALTVIEIIVGALNPILLVPPAVAVAHLTVATVIWILLTGAATISMSANRHGIPAKT